jgi:hypothetical protein
MDQPRLSYTDLYFGLADGKNEALENRAEFIKSFVDQGAIDQILSDNKFLILGPKGVGKSALAWYLELTQSQRGYLIETRDISELPFGEIEGMQTGENAGPGRTTTAWRLLLLCGLLDLILKDNASSLQRDPEVIRVANELRKLGFLDPTPKRAVIESSKKTFKLPVPGLGEVFSYETQNRVHLYNLVPIIENWILGNESPNHYLLAIDGLDSIWLNDSRFSPVLGALLQAASLLGQALRSAANETRLVVLVRSDLFSRLNITNPESLKQDRGVELDWRIMTGQPAKSKLFQLLNRKAVAVAGGPPVDVVRTFFPKDIQLGGRRGATPPKFVETYKYLLDLTRHTPRDLLQLCAQIQARAREIAYPWNGVLTQAIIREGVVRYSSKYFVDAISSELRGWAVGDGSLISRSLDALRNVPRIFDLDQFSQQLFGDSSASNRADAGEVLRWLFFAGGVGNVRDGAARYMQFYHRREQSNVYLRGKFVRHTALNYATGEPW